MAEFTKERIIEELKASTQNSSGMFEVSEDTICALMSMLTYAAPQLPQPAVVSFDEWSRKCDLQIELCDQELREKGRYIWDEACRAAMLQGAEPVQEWIPCGERMPQKSERVLIFINFNSETVPPSIHDAQFTGSTFRRGNATVNVFPLEDGYGVTHWMPLPAAPQQD